VRKGMEYWSVGVKVLNAPTPGITPYLNSGIPAAQPKDFARCSGKRGHGLSTIDDSEYIC